MLHHHGSGCHLVAVADVPDFEANEVAAAQLAVVILPLFHGSRWMALASVPMMVSH